MSRDHEEGLKLRRMVWEIDVVRHEIARHLPSDSLARIICVNRASFDTAVPQLWRHADLDAYCCLKGNLNIPQHRSNAYMQALKTITLTGQLPLVRDPPADVFCLFEALPALCRIDWTGGYTEWSLDRQSPIQLRTTQMCDMALDMEDGTGVETITVTQKDPTSWFETTRSIVRTYSIIVNAYSYDSFEDGVDSALDEVCQVLQAVDPWEITLDSDTGLNTFLPDLVPIWLRSFKNNLTHPLLIKLEMDAHEWSSILPSIRQIGAKGARFDIDTWHYADGPDALLFFDDCSSVSQYLTHLRFFSRHITGLPAPGRSASPSQSLWIGSGPGDGRSSHVLTINETSTLQRFEIVLYGEPPANNLENFHSRLGLFADCLLAIGGRHCAYDLSIDLQYVSQEQRYPYQILEANLRSVLLREIGNRLTAVAKPVGWQRLPRSNVAAAANIVRYGA